MSERLYVATRKGLFSFDRTRAGWEIAGTAFLGEPVTMMLDDARDGMLYAALNLGHFGVKLHRSVDRGASWEEIAAPAFPSEDPEAGREAELRSSADAAPIAESIDEATGQAPQEKKGPSVHQVWALASGGPSQDGVLWAGTIPGALFRSNDRGASWGLVRSLWDRPERAKWFGGGYDEPGIHSICVDPRDERHITVGVSCGGVWVTEDEGQSWACRAEGMFADYMPPELRGTPEIQDPHRLVQCPAAPDALWVQHHNGVFRSTDGSKSWSVVESVKPSVFGFAVAVHPADPETAWFVPAVKDECRIPVDGQVVVARTRDGGTSFDVLRHGLPQRHAYDLVYRHALDIDRTGERLAMGSTTGGLWTTDDGGDSWRALSLNLPPVYQVLFAAR